MLVSSLSKVSVDAALKAAVTQGILCAPTTIEEAPVAVFYDLDAYRANLAMFRDSFPKHFLHANAIKTNPVSGILNIARQEGHGAECASLGEVRHALKLGFEPYKIVYDSPVKTYPEIVYALEHGVHLNIDNHTELDTITKLVEEKPELGQKSTIGVRINPMVGGGKISQLSVATGNSKFGMRCGSDEEKEKLAKLVAERPWISAVHVHSGSQGMGLELLVGGIQRAVAFCELVNELAGKKQIAVFDMGGGLSVNYKDDEITPTPQEYAAQLEKDVPLLWDPAFFDRVVTEFGAAFNCKFGWVGSRVEYCKEGEDRNIALIHAGADIFVRDCYGPGVYMTHRITAYDDQGTPKDTDACQHDLCGPLCFAGDTLVRGIDLPRLQTGDYVVIREAGGNTLSIFSRHNSRMCPRVYTYHVEKEDVVFDLVKPTESIDSVLNFWGLDHTLKQ